MNDVCSRTWGALAEATARSTDKLPVVDGKEKELDDEDDDEQSLYNGRCKRATGRNRRVREQGPIARDLGNRGHVPDTSCQPIVVPLIPTLKLSLTRGPSTLH
jgi:hypothetical protein